VERVEKGPPARGRTGWFANFGLPHAVCAGLRPVDAERVGVLFRVVETAGKPGRADLRFCRDPKSARLVNGRNELIFELFPVGDSLPVDFGANEFQQIEARFNEPPSPPVESPEYEGD
jgi:hypothetical protein